ncbi:MAG: hypothetical protein JNK79_14790 [Chitinophagaceae bacterium]|nr:hypothetical protein [Chitinophagaceae bacterium]
MKKIISFFLFAVYCSFVAGTLFTATEDADFIYHSSEFKGKYISSTDDGLSYFISQPANVKKVQKHLPFNGKIKLTRPNISSEFFSTMLSPGQVAFNTSPRSFEKPGYSSVSLYIKNRILQI